MSQQQSQSPSFWDVISNDGLGAGVGAMSDMLSKGANYGNMLGGQSRVAQGLGGLSQGGFNPAGSALTRGAGVANNLLQPVALVGGAQTFGSGMDQALNGDDTTGGIMSMIQGAGSAVAGGIGTAGLLGSAMSGIAGLASGAGAGFGGLSALGSAGGALTGAATAGTGALGMGTAVGAAGALPIAAAIGGGAAAGLAIGNRGQDYIANTGLLGQNSDGTGRNWSDWGADTAVSADRAVAEATGSETLGTVAGLATCAGTSIVGAAGAAVTGVAGLATDAYDFVTSW